MIPVFPEFKKLELSDKQEFEGFVKKFEPYSDFNFVSLWSYNTQNNFECSYLNKNLVIKMCDYISLNPFYSFLGTQKVDETIRTLFNFLKKKQLPLELKLVPEVNLLEIRNQLQTEFQILEDIDNFDYVYDLEVLILAEGGAYKVMRNMISKFKRSTETFTLSLANLREETIKDQITNLTCIWGQARNKTQDEMQNELTGIKRLLESAQSLELTCLCLFVKDNLKAFFISEKIDDQYALAHFRKADPSIAGIFQFIDYENAKQLQELHCKYLNYEQDLGIPSLRRSKKSLNPYKYLKKYTISSDLQPKVV